MNAVTDHGGGQILSPPSGRPPGPRRLGIVDIKDREQPIFKIPIPATRGIRPGEYSGADPLGDRPG